MIVQSAKIVGEVMEMVIDGLVAKVIEPKLPLLEAGWVVLIGNGWYERLGITQLPAYWHPDYPNSAELSCLTNEPIIVELTRRFVSGQYPSGELAIPQ